MSQSDFVSRGQALVAAGQYQEAVKVCRLGLLGKPTTVEGRVVLGQALLALKRHDEVLAEMRVALELDATSVQAQVLKGEALLRKGDAHAAIEALHKALQLAPGDKRVLALLGEAEDQSIRPQALASHPAVGFVGGAAEFNSEPPTKHYPGHGSADDDPLTSDSFTKPTSIAAPAAAKKRGASQPAVTHDPTPSPDVLAVGDRSGTVEVDPSVDRLTDSIDEDLDEPIAPPPGRAAPRPDNARGAVRTGRSPAPAPASAGGGGRGKRPSQQTFDLDPEIDDIDDDDGDAGETLSVAKRGRVPGPMSAVRAAVQMPSGPLGEPNTAPRRDRAASLPAPDGRTKPATAPPPLGRALADKPVAFTAPPLPPTPQPLPPAPSPGSLAPPLQRNLVAAMPTMAAPMPQPPPPPLAPASMAAAARPTLAIPSPPHDGGPAWARQTYAADQRGLPQQMKPPPPPLAANEPTVRPSGLDPAIQALLAAEARELPPDASGAIVAREPAPMVSTGPEGVPAPRRRRSPLRVVLLLMLALVVIGGGVFAGLQIRAMRLRHQIADTLDKAAGLAKADTYGGWLAAKNSLVDIVKVSSTTDNRARLARVRATIAFEFGDGVPDAKAAVDDLGNDGSADGDVAAAYLALALGDAKAAKTSGEAAVADAPDDAAALYVVGQALELAGDSKAAVKQLGAAFEKETRPAFAIGLARALASTYAWDEAIAALDRVLAANADHPAAAIARARMIARAGRVALATEARAAVDRVLAEAQKPAAQQPHGVSPAQAAHAELALVELDFARGDNNAVRADLAAAKSLARQNAVIDDEQRFAEDLVEALAFAGQLDEARRDAEVTLDKIPTSRRARVALAEIALAQGRASDAIDVLAKQAEINTVPRALAVRGQARLALGNYDDARADFELALKKLPTLEPAIVGRAWLDLAMGDVDSARKPIDKAFDATKTPSAAIATVYAAILRRGDKDAREKAKTILDKIVAAPLGGIDLTRAQLELARVDRDLGDVRGAIAHYAEAAKAGSVEARVESGLLQIDNKDPSGGRETLEGVLRAAGAKPPASLLLDVARARMLVGDHAGAVAALDQAKDAPGVEKWRLDRERARLALRKDDARTAAPLVGRALDGSGDDVETFLVAADVPVLDPSQSALADRIAKELPRLAKHPGAAQLVTGKLAIAAGKYDDAERAFATATDLLKAQSASSRLIAQAYYGSLLVAYYKNDEPTAMNKVEFIVAADPSLYAAYEASGFMLKDRKQSRSALDQLKKAVALDPDLVTAWLEIGSLAAGLGDKAQLQQAIDKLQKISPADAAELIKLTSKR